MIMRISLRVLVALAAALLSGAPALAGPVADHAHYRAELVTESRAPASGAAVTAAFHIALKPGWHIYGPNPGDTGYAPVATWTAPPGTSAGELRHPPTRRLVLSGLVSNVHEGDVVLLQDLRLPVGLAAGAALPLAAHLDLLVCSESSCVPDPVDLDLGLTVGAGNPDPTSAALFARARAAITPPAAAKSAAAPAPSPLDLAGYLLAFGAALLGGLILNLMPCVFPILSLKAMALARSGGSAGHARSEALGYSAGVIGTVLALGGALLVLRGAGSAAGWAFQLQNPAVVAGLLLLITAIALNMTGLFELPSLSVSGKPSSGFSGSLMTGALAAFIATPCTGPFMAGALGAALVMPPLAALGVFAGLGLGMALPFLLLGFWAPARRMIPRPGQWMVTLRHVLSVPMFATALGLAWLVGRQAGIGAMTTALGAALLMGLALWWYGVRQRGGRPGLPALVLASAALPVIALGVVAAPAAATGPAVADALGSQPFAESRLDALRREGRPVFVYFTADWCLTCKVNEAAALDVPAVGKAFAAGGVSVLRGDWTRQDPAISRFLKAHGRAGVPLYLWYPAGGEPSELPQVLSSDLLVRLTDRS
ncbi:thioredoxin family protein [Novosphingobium sp.]|uniref:protein-disulfide reductase DsbD family protein n=1 Tax=Novosphingobium sp. TaxID=1874826 RepID=UPI00344EC70D